MSNRAGLTLVELLVVIAIVAMLTGLVLPTLSLARERARVIACGAGMRGVHQAVIAYAVMNERYLPPFRFSSVVDYSLPESGHWGGISSGWDPVAMSHWGDGGKTFSVNLWSLVDGGYIAPERLICPGAPVELRSGAGSLFPYTNKFSTYCLRFPYSSDLFRHAPSLAFDGCGDLLNVLAMACGGQRVRRRIDPAKGAPWQTVPQVRIDRRYRIAPEAGCGDGDYDVATDVMLADTFWYRDRDEGSASQPGMQTYPVRAWWCHGDEFNAVSGDGAVRTMRDDGTKIRPFTNAPVEGGNPHTLAPDGCCDANYAEKVWQFLDGKL